MRENRYDKLLLVSIILIVLSSLLLVVSAYNVYFKNHDLKSIAHTKSASLILLPLRDSLEKIYNNTVTDIKNNLPPTNARNSSDEIKIKLEELDTLREEIQVLLANKNNNTDLLLAKVKIEELHQKVSFLQSKYTGIETENKRLQNLIIQLLNAKTTNSESPSTVTNEKIKPTVEKRYASKSPIAASLHLFAVVNNNTNEQETTTAENAEKMVGTFVVKNLPAKGNGELLIVVLQPDGKVVKNSVWESGTFETTEGKKIYSRKIYTETASEEKQLNFSLTPDRFLKGDYIMQIWYNGSMIAKMTKTLS